VLKASWYSGFGSPVFCAGMSRDQTVGRSHSMKIDNSSFEMVEEFKYLGTTKTNQNHVQE
jgi:hypothetical protein